MEDEQIAQEQAEATVLRLASKTVECPEEPFLSPKSYGINLTATFSWKHQESCESCQGSGTIPDVKFAGLREMCPCNKAEDSDAYHETFDAYPKCNGHRLFPVSTEKAATELRKREELKAWVLDESFDPYHVRTRGVWLVHILCNDLLTIAAAGRRWPEEENDPTND